MQNFYINIRAILAVIIILLSFLFMFMLLFVRVPDENKAIVYTASGLMLAGMGAVTSYYFGSSKNESDKAKTDQANLQNPPPAQSIVETKTTEVK